MAKRKRTKGQNICIRLHRQMKIERHTLNKSSEWTTKKCYICSYKKIN